MTKSQVKTQNRAKKKLQSYYDIQYHHIKTQQRELNKTKWEMLRDRAQVEKLPTFKFQEKTNKGGGNRNCNSTSQTQIKDKEYTKSQKVG